MTRGCSLPTCGRSPAKKSSCCGLRLCEEHAATCAAHSCPTQALLMRGIAAASRRETPEGKLKREIDEALTKLGVWFVRVNAGGFRGRMKGAPKGTPDFLGVLDSGRPFAVEAKATHSDTCSRKTCGCAAQRATRADLERRRVLYVHGRDLESVLGGLGLPLPAKQLELSSERSAG